MRVDAFIVTGPSRSGYVARVWRLTRPDLAAGLDLRAKADAAAERGSKELADDLHAAARRLENYPAEHVRTGTFYGRTEDFAFKAAERYALREYGRVVLDPLAPRDAVRYARSATHREREET